MFSDPLEALGLNVIKKTELPTSQQRMKEAKQRIKRMRNKELSQKDYGYSIPSMGLTHLKGADRVYQVTKKNWIEKYSPAAIRKWLATSKYARIWMMIQVLFTVIAIFNYIALTYSSKNQNTYLQLIITKKSFVKD